MLFFLAIFHVPPLYVDIVHGIHLLCRYVRVLSRGFYNGTKVLEDIVVKFLSGRHQGFLPIFPDMRVVFLASAKVKKSCPCNACYVYSCREGSSFSPSERVHDDVVHHDAGGDQFGAGAEKEAQEGAEG